MEEEDLAENQPTKVYLEKKCETGNDSGMLLSVV